MKRYFLISFSDGKLYDAYIIYPRVFRGSAAGTHSVEYFVHHTLPDVLENKCGYKLCIYGRDLLPGQGKPTETHQGLKLFEKKFRKGDYG
jgi:interleukin 1 receptor-like 1